ncbi:MAG: DUF1015 domain-containing protein, partial [Jatrophihabitans sp.]
MSAATEDGSGTTPSSSSGLSLAPFRGLRPSVEVDRIAKLLCPPYDVIDAGLREQLLAIDPDNAVAVVLPERTEIGYATAATQLSAWVEQGVFTPDVDEALYVYEMCDADGAITRGLLGAVELRDPADGVILPHENTMAGPVADRLAVMTATNTDLEPIYLVYDGGGATSRLVGDVDVRSPDVVATTDDGITHRLWMITDPSAHQSVADDLADRHALIADGHHRYATYRERQRLRREHDGVGPWDRGLALLVDTSEYGPAVHPIHRAIVGVRLVDAVARLREWGEITQASDPETALDSIVGLTGFAAVLTDGVQTLIITDAAGRLATASERTDSLPALTELDVTVLHRGLVETALALAD